MGGEGDGGSSYVFYKSKYFLTFLKLSTCIAFDSLIKIKTKQKILSKFELGFKCWSKSKIQAMINIFCDLTYGTLAPMEFI